MSTHRKRRAAALALAGFAALATAARAEPYWIAYEGNVFPEEEGWARYASDPPAERWLQDGSLFIDSRANGEIYESYAMQPQAGFDPGPGETFVMRWRLCVHDSPLWSPGVGFSSDERRAVIFLFDNHRVMSFFEPGIYVELEPGVLHEFEMRSSDMARYRLYIDGIAAIEGEFFNDGPPPLIAFGDLTTNGSFAEWDYFRFGVVPEPGTCLGAVAGLALLRSWRRPMMRARRVLRVPTGIEAGAKR